MRTTLTRALVGLGLAGALFLGAGAAVARRPTTPRRARPPRPRRTARAPETATARPPTAPKGPTPRATTPRAAPSGVLPARTAARGPDTLGGAAPRPSGPGGGSEPAAALEDGVQGEADHQHQGQGEGEPAHTAQLRHVGEVHAVDGADQGGGEQDGRPGRHLLDLLVLVVAGLGEVLDLLVLGLADQGGVDGEDVGQH